MMKIITETPAKLFMRAFEARTEEACLEFRREIAPRTHHSDERQELALQQALVCQHEGHLEMAETWALRALHDGPCRTVLCLLGDICEATADLRNALRWYRLAVATPADRRFDDACGGVAETLRAVDPAARLDAIERGLRESWHSVIPAREVRFAMHAAYSALDTRQEIPTAVQQNEPVLVGKADYSVAEVSLMQTALLDDDLAFIAWDVPLALPFGREEPFPRMLILSVRETPLFGGPLTVSVKTAKLLGDGPFDDVTIASKLPLHAKYGAYRISAA